MRAATRTRTTGVLPPHSATRWHAHDWWLDTRTWRSREQCKETEEWQQLKYSQSTGLINYIVLLIGLIWSCNQVPVKWLTASITWLYKKGRKSLAENYRGLSIIATISKVLSGIVVERIREVYEHTSSCSHSWALEPIDRPLTPYMYYVIYSRMQGDQRGHCL